MFLARPRSPDLGIILSFAQPDPKCSVFLSPSSFPKPDARSIIECYAIPSNMTIWQIRHHLAKNHGHHPCKYGHFGKLSDRATLPSSTSAPFRCPRVPRNTLRRHFRPFPPPKGATRHSPVTLPPLSAAQGCRATLPGDTSDPFRRPRVPRDTLRRHFRPFPPPKGATRHSPVTLPPLSAAQGCRAMRQENYSNSLLSTATSTWILRAIRFVSTRYFLFKIKAKRHLSSTPKSLTESTLK